MLKKTVTYEDWNGVTRTEDFYFNLTRVECAEIEFGTNGVSLSESIQDLIAAKDMGTVISIIKKILLMSYGIKSPDGKRFIKNDDVRDSFEQNPAFDILYMELATDSEAAAEFLSGIMPSAVRDNLGSDPKKALLDKMNEFGSNSGLTTV